MQEVKTGRFIDNAREALASGNAAAFAVHGSDTSLSEFVTGGSHKGGL